MSTKTTEKSPPQKEGKPCIQQELDRFHEKGTAQKQDGEIRRLLLNIIEKRCVGEEDRAALGRALAEKSGNEKEYGMDLEKILAGAISGTYDEIGKKIIEVEKLLNPTVEAGRLLFKYWPRGGDYDEHMNRTGHDKGVETLISALVELDRLGFGSAPGSIIGDRLIEMSCGTGTVIKLLREKFSPEEAARLNVVCNERSSAMLEMARGKLGEERTEYTNYDAKNLSEHIREAGPHSMDNGDNGLEAGSFSSAILSQTLHLLMDPKMVRYEMYEPDLLSQHIETKEEVMKNAFKLLREGGHFILIDEWPAVFTSKTPANVREAIVERLFQETFKPIWSSKVASFLEWELQRTFVGKFAAPIDGKHSMYVLLYKNERTDEKDTGVTDQGQKDRAAGRLIEAFKRTDLKIVHGWGPQVREGMPDYSNIFIPFGEGKILESRGPDPMPEGGQYDSIVLVGKMREVGLDNWSSFLKKTVKMVKLDGTVLVIEPIDELDRLFEREYTNYEGDPRFHKEDFEKYVTMHDGTLMFEGMLRETIAPGSNSGMYGCLCRKVWEGKS